MLICVSWSLCSLSAFTGMWSHWTPQGCFVPPHLSLSGSLWGLVSFNPSSMLPPLSVSPPSATCIPPTVGLLSPSASVSASHLSLKALLPSPSFLRALQRRPLRKWAQLPVLSVHFPFRFFSCLLGIPHYFIPFLCCDLTLSSDLKLCLLTNVSFCYPLWSLNNIISKHVTSSALLLSTQGPWSCSGCVCLLSMSFFQKKVQRYSFSHHKGNCQCMP